MKPSGKIEVLTYKGNEVPTVTFFGEVEPKDIQMLPVAIRMTYFGEYLKNLGKDELSKAAETKEEKEEGKE